MSKEKKQAVKSWMTFKLRGLSLQWKPKNWAKQDARVERGKYKCADCGEIFGPKDIALDHIEPVIPLEKYDDITEEIAKNEKLRELTKTENDDKRFRDFFDLFIRMSRMFVQKEGFQVLCHSCHEIKTNLEDELMGRTGFRKKEKK